MKRLLRVGTNILISSLIPVLCYFLLGLTLNANLANIFSITYPFQFISAFLIHVFGTGANVKAEKEKNINAVYSGLILGSIIGALIFGTIHHRLGV